MAAPSTTRELTGSAPVALDDPEVAWLVSAGRVQVFAVVDARRRPLFSVGPGEALLTLAPDAPIRLLAVGLEEGTAVEAVPVGDLDERAAQIWTGRLREFVARMDPSWNGADIARGLAHAFATEDGAATGRLEAREAYEAELQTDAYTTLGAVLGGRPSALADGGGDGLLAAFRLVGEHLGCTIVAPPRSAAGGVEPVEAIARASRIRIRRIALEGEWWRADAGPLLGRRAGDGRPVALLPRRGGYAAVDPADGTSTRVDAATAARLVPAAIMPYRPLPAHRLRRRDVVRFALQPLGGDAARVALYGLAVGLLSLIPPIVANVIFSRVVPEHEHSSLIWLTGLLAVFALSSFGFVLAMQLAVLRIEGRAFSDLQSALLDRLLDLPLPFFRRYSSGSLTIRVLGVGQVRALASATITTAAIAVPVTLANVVLAFALQPRLALFGAIAIVGMVAVVVVLVRRQIRRERRVQSSRQELFGTSVQLVAAIGKLRVADAGLRGFAQWAGRFAALKRSFYSAQLSFVGTSSLTAATAAVGTVLVVLGAATLRHGTVSAATFIAFNTAFIQALAGVVALTTIGTFVAHALPLWENTQPILDEQREASGLRTDPGELRGAIEVSHVSLRYAADAPLVLDDVSFRVDPGEFVAIVGPSGSGKSSLVRVVLGFEQPELGSVSYDGNGLDTLDPHAVRRQMGVVIQSARLLPGNVFQNIAGSRPLTMEDAWAAASIAGIADDIRAMPMGMHTWVSEAGTTFSGGQRQRLLIARGVAGKPRILVFDEATSALDNRTQAEVSGAIAALEATRIVIAHRLSTVRLADQILVVEGGKVVQRGAFDDLIAGDGPFKRLAHRQLI